MDQSLEDPAKNHTAGKSDSGRLSLSELIDTYRRLGHINADTNPLDSTRELDSEITLQQNELADELEQAFQNADLGDIASFRAAIKRELERLYSGRVGFEFAHLDSRKERAWFIQKIEQRQEDLGFSETQQANILKQLLEAEAFEYQIGKAYPFKKRFSLNGHETLIPMLKSLGRTLAENGTSELILGMAHRGRLNTLINILDQPLEEIILGFEDKGTVRSECEDDVRYHLGYRKPYTADAPSITLLPNPSHLESINPVMQGFTRARQEDFGTEAVFPLLIHGDAAFSGQGIVAETLNLSRLSGYSTRGTVHIVLNNQIGFTTTEADSRSTLYSTDIAKGFQIPVLHVSAENPLEAVWAMELAAEYRNTFGKDIVLDLVGFRRYGHNEMDQPAFTQPLIYQEISEKPALSEKLKQELLGSSSVTELELAEVIHHQRELVKAAVARVKFEGYEVDSPCAGFRDPDRRPITSVDFHRLIEIAESLSDLPEGFSLHPKLERQIEKRVSAVKSAEAIDWGLAEALAFGSILQDGISIRVSGEDSQRGTFSQRHSVYHDYRSGEEYLPLQKVATPNTDIAIYNSPLSEAAVLGFEFGYSNAKNNSMVIWEAQFGDFANGAQVVIDEYLTGADKKWNQKSNLVLLLPHGYDGQGPNHSSARIERFLQLAAEENIRVVNPSTAGQYFHLLREQALSDEKKPLVVFTPKSLLRRPSAAASAAELTTEGFKNVIESLKVANPEKIVFTSGKFAHEIEEELAKEANNSVAVVRIEQLFPLPAEELSKLVRFNWDAEFIWAQEEPKNMGAWTFINEKFVELFNTRLEYVGRPASATTATGSGGVHQRETTEILEALRSICRAQD